MKSFRVTDPQGNVYVMIPVDSTARTAAASASALATSLNVDSVKYKNIVSDPNLDEYDPTATYAVGDFCYYENELYECNTPIASPGETWNPDHWTKIIVKDLIDAAKAVADEAAQEIESAKNLTFDEDFFTPDETDDEVNIKLNGVPFGVDDDTPLQILQDTQEGIVLGADSPFQTVIAPLYDSTSSYGVGDYVMYKSKYYRCANASSTPAGDWDEADWAETSVDEILGNISTALDTINDNLESVSHAGMYDLGDKTESNLNDGKLAIGAGNSTTKLTLTTVSALTVLANSGVPNFALVIDNSSNSNNVTITVKDSTNTTTFMQSVSAGNEATAGKIYQITCVGNCWTLAEFGTANA
jgi:hypothetical protein